MKPFLEAAREKAYRKSRELAIGETNLPDKTFPSDCPYSLEQILDEGFYPGETSIN